jgi:hypothetical protein
MGVISRFAPNAKGTSCSPSRLRSQALQVGVAAHRDTLLSTGKTLPMARDIFHNVVRKALIQDGWTITADPYILSVGGVEMQIDLGAERLIAATRDEERIAVEVKSFVSPSALSEFHTALGQYLNYRIALAMQSPERKLFLAIPIQAFDSFFQLPFPEQVISQFELALLVYDPDKESITQWIP